MIRGLSWCLILAIASGFAPQLLALSQTWDGNSGINQNYSTATNWVSDPLGSDLPGASDTATFPVGGPWQVVHDPAAPSSIGTLLIQDDTILTLASGSALEVETLTIASGRSLTVVGSGTLRVDSLVATGATLAVAGSTATLEFLSSVNLSGLTAFSNTGTLRLSGVGVVLNATGVANLGNVSVANGADVDVSSSFASGGTLAVGVGAVLDLQGITVAGLNVLVGASVAVSGAATVTSSLQLSGTLECNNGLTMSGQLTTLAAGSVLLVNAVSPLSFTGGGDLVVDRSATFTVSGNLIVGAMGLTTVLNTDTTAVGGPSPVIGIGGNLVLGGPMADINQVAAHSHAARWNIAGNLLIGDSAGFSINLDDSLFNLSNVMPQFGFVPAAGMFNGSITLGFLNLPRNLAMPGFPAGTRVTLLGLAVGATGSLDTGSAQLVLAGEYSTLSGSPVTSGVGGSVRPGNGFRGLTPAATLPSFVVPAAEVVRIAGHLTVSGGVTVQGGGTLEVGRSAAAAEDATLIINGEVLAEAGSSTAFGAAGPALTNVEVSISGGVTMRGGSHTLGATNADVSFSVDGTWVLGQTGISDAVVTVAADTLANNGQTALTIGGNLTMISISSRFLMGEGALMLGGDLDAGFADGHFDFTIDPDVMGNRTQIHLMADFATHGLQNLNFSASGTPFFVDSISPTVRIFQTGRMILRGTLDLRGQTDGTVTVWQSALGSIDVGRTTQAATGTLLVGNAVVQVPTLTVKEFHAPASFDGTRFSQLLVQRASGAAGRLEVATLVIEADRNDTDSLTGGLETNAGFLDVAGCEVRVGVLTIQEGVSFGAGGGGNGGRLRASASTLLANGNWNVGSTTTALSQTQGARLEVVNSGLQFSNGNILNIRRHASLLADGSTLTSQGAGAWSLNVANNAGVVSFIDSVVTASAPGNGSFVLGGAVEAPSVRGLELIRTTFSNSVSAGVVIADDTTITTFNECQFLSGQNNGRHLRFNGRASAAGGARLFANSNTFDSSTAAGNWGNIFNDSARIVSVANPAVNVAVTFRVSALSGSFGTDLLGNPLTTALAEQDDNDPSRVSPIADVLWDLQDAVRLEVVAPFTGPMAVPVRTGGSKGAAALFSLQALGSDQQLASLSVTFDAGSLNGPGVGVGVADAIVLFADSGTATGVFDAADSVVAMNDGLGLMNSGGVLTFDLSAAPQALLNGVARRFGIALTFGTGSNGVLLIRIDANDPDFVSGDVILDGAPAEFRSRPSSATVFARAGIANGAPGLRQTFFAPQISPMVLALELRNDLTSQPVVVDAVQIQVNVRSNGLTGDQAARFIKRLVMFRSMNNVFDTTYVDDPAQNFGERGDDEFFATVTGGLANFPFLTGNSNVVVTLDGDDFLLPAGATVTLFLVLDAADDSMTLETARTGGLELVFSLQENGDGDFGGIVTTGLNADSILVTTNQAPFVDAIFSKTWIPITMLGLSSGSSGCAQVGAGGGGWALAVMLGLVAWIARYRFRRAASRRAVGR